METKFILKPAKEYASVCGLFCPSCTIFIGSHEDPERLKALALNSGEDPSEFRCEGCRSDIKAGECKHCKIIECASDKGVEFCVECNMFPCSTFDNFQSILPHRIEVYHAQQMISEIGFEAWFKRMEDHYACEKCQTINSAYDMQCRICGHSPSNEYIRINVDEMLERF